MANFDFSNLKGMFGGTPSPDGGWASGTVTSPEGAFFSRSNDGSVAGITEGGTDAIARGLRGAAAQMPGGGAFRGPPPSGIELLNGTGYGHAPLSGGQLLNPQAMPQPHQPAPAPAESAYNAPASLWQRIMRSGQGG